MQSPDGDNLKDIGLTHWPLGNLNEILCNFPGNKPLPDTYWPRSLTPYGVTRPLWPFSNHNRTQYNHNHGTWQLTCPQSPITQPLFRQFIRTNYNKYNQSSMSLFLCGNPSVTTLSTLWRTFHLACDINIHNRGHNDIAFGLLISEAANIPGGEWLSTHRGRVTNICVSRLDQHYLR